MHPELSKTLGCIAFLSDRTQHRLKLAKDFTAGATADIVVKRPIDILTDETNGTIGHGVMNATSVLATGAWPIGIRTPSSQERRWKHVRLISAPSTEFEPIRNRGTIWLRFQGAVGMIGTVT